MNAPSKIMRALRGVPLAPAIHPMNCPCSDCDYGAHRRALRGDLVALALGVGGALAAVVAVYLTGLGPR